MVEVPVPPRKRKWKRRAIVLAGALLVLLPILAYLFPYLLKRYIEEHSVEWIDRKVTIGSIVLNPFSFTYGIHDLKCMEPRGSDQVFVSWKEVSVKADLWDGWRKNAWRFRQARMIAPYVHIVQQGDRFNFSDLMALAGAPDTTRPQEASRTVFSIEDIELADGAIDYASDLLRSPARLRNLHARCSRITSESARMDFDLGFHFVQGGEVQGGFMIDTERSRYSIDGRLSNFALPQLLPYLQDLMHTSSLVGRVDLDLHLRDSWSDSTALAVKARLGLDHVAIGDEQGVNLISLEKGVANLDTLDARSKTFRLRSVLVDGLNTRYEMFNDGSDTWSKALKLTNSTIPGDTGVMLASSEANVFVMLADYIRMLGQDFVANEYNADSLIFTRGTLQFHDFTPERPFRYTLSALDIRTARARSDGASVDVTASAVLNGKGKLVSAFAFDPKNFKNVDATMHVADLVLPDLDPYMRWYAAHPLKQGTMSYEGATTIKDGAITSHNHIMADQLKLGKKTEVHDSGIYVLPLRLAVSLLKDKNGRIDLDLPVEGDLNDPKFKPWPIVWQVLKNLLTKAVAAPGRMLARAIGGGEAEDVEEVRFEVLQAGLRKEQIKPLTALANALRSKQDLICDLVPLVDPVQEREELAAFKVKKDLLGLTTMTAADSVRVLSFSTRDTALVRFLDVRSPGTKGRPERERCLAIVGADQVQADWQALVAQREANVLHVLAGAGLSPGRVRVRLGTPGELAGSIGLPGYKFIYDAAPEE